MVSTDILIIGSGPAGLTAGIYAGRGGKSCVIIGGDVGGQASKAYEVENYPGFKKIKGYELMNSLILQATGFGASLVFENATFIDVKSKTVVTDSGETYQGKALILSMGQRHKDLSLENESELIGSGISYCATCDGNFYKKKKVAVVGGGDTAISDALFLSGIASEVTVIHRRKEFKAAPSLVNRMFSSSIKLCTPAKITKLIGNPLSAVEITYIDTEKKETIELNGLFVAVGSNPNTDLIENQVQFDGKHLKSTNCEVYDLENNIIEGVYAAGDLRKKVVRQIVTACADGAIAATSALEFINNQNK